MTPLQIVQQHVRTDYLYAPGVDPLGVVQITPVEQADDVTGAQPGDYRIADEVVGRVVRVVDGAVREIWSNG